MILTAPSQAVLLLGISVPSLQQFAVRIYSGSEVVLPYFLVSVKKAGKSESLGDCVPAPQDDW